MFNDSLNSFCLCHGSRTEAYCVPTPQAQKRQQVARILQQAEARAERQCGRPAVAISSSQLTVDPARGAELVIRNISSTTVVFSFGGAPEQVRYVLTSPGLFDDCLAHVVLSAKPSHHFLRARCCCYDGPASAYNQQMELVTCSVHPAPSPP